MAAIHDHSSSVKGSVASPGVMPEPRQQVTSSPAKPYAAAAVTANSLPTAGVLQMALDRHYRAVGDSIISGSVAWKEGRSSIRFLNQITPMIIGVLRAGGSTDARTVKESLDYLITTTDSLSKVMAKAVSSNPDLERQEIVELNSIVSAFAGKIWADKDGGQDRLDQLLRLVSTLYQDESFAAKHTELAHEMMEAGYRRADTPESMESRLSNSLHIARAKLFSATTSKVISSAAGVTFMYGKPAVELYKALCETFNTVVANLIGKNRFADNLTNDQRAGLMQVWVRHAGDIFLNEYIAQTQRKMDWFRAGEAESKQEFLRRFAEVKNSLHATLEAAGIVTLDMMACVIATSDSHAMREIGREDESPSYSAPR